MQLFWDLRNRMEETHTQEAHVADYLWTYLPTELQERTENLEDTALRNSHYF